MAVSGIRFDTDDVGANMRGRAYKSWFRRVVGLAVLAALLPALRAAAVTLIIGDLIIAGQNQTALGNDGRIILIDPMTGAQTLISSHGLLDDPSSVAIDALGRILVADGNAQNFTGAIIRIDPTNGVQTLLSTGGLLHRPVGVAVDAYGDIYVTQHFDGPRPSGVLRIDPITGAQTPLSLGGFFRVAQRIAFDAAGDLLVTDAQSLGPGFGAAIRVNRLTGAQTLVSSSLLRTPHGIALEPDGQIIVSENDINPDLARITRIDPVTGAGQLVSGAGLMRIPADANIDLHGVLRIADLNTLGLPGSIIEIDRFTGAQRILSTGGLLLNPTGITSVVPEPSCPLLVLLGMLAKARRRAVPATPSQKATVARRRCRPYDDSCR